MKCEKQSKCETLGTKTKLNSHLEIESTMLGVLTTPPQTHHWIRENILKYLFAQWHY